MRAIAVGLITLVVVTLSACIADPAIGGAEAEVRVTAEYEQPPAWMEMPISIGGDAYFVEITGPQTAGGEVRADGFIVALAPGHYRIEVVTRPWSDAVAIDVMSGEARREFGPATARCSADVDLQGLGVAVVHYTAVGGEVCRLEAQS
jgi:hypothetical protein